MPPTHCSFETSAPGEHGPDPQVMAEIPNCQEPNQPTSSSCVPEPQQQQQPASSAYQVAPPSIPVPADSAHMQPLLVQTSTPPAPQQLQQQFPHLGGYFFDQSGMLYGFPQLSTNSSPGTTASSTPVHFQHDAEAPVSSENSAAAAASYSMPVPYMMPFYATPPMGSPLMYPNGQVLQTATPYGSPMAAGQQAPPPPPVPTAVPQYVPVGPSAPQNGFQAPVTTQYITSATTATPPPPPPPPHYVSQATAQTPPQMGTYAQAPPPHVLPPPPTQYSTTYSSAPSYTTAPPPPLAAGSALQNQNCSAVPALPQLERLNLNNVPMYRPSSSNVKKQPSNMAEIWHNEFNTRFSHYGGSWELIPAIQGCETADGIFEDTAKIRFVCKHCSHAWTSMQGKVKFWYTFDRTTQHGQVFFQLFGQKCKQCKEKYGSDEMQDALWYPDEIAKVVHNIHAKVGMIYYNIQSPMILIQRRIGRPKGQHNADLCAACQKGICRRNSPNPNLRM